MRLRETVYSLGRNRPLPYFIAEIGFNHGGNIGLAKKMIESATSSGVDAVKFQTYRAQDLALPSSKHFKTIKAGEMNLKQHLGLAGIAKANKIDFISTPYSRQAVDLLEKAGVKAYKIASMDLTNTELLRCVAKTRKPLIVSTGMATLSEISSAIKILRSLKSGPVTLLHCISKYPANPEDLNLSFMDRIRQVCGCPVGYSDHTKGTMACFIAAIFGAAVIEKHFTLDSSMRGADHYHSAEPWQFKKLIEDVRLAFSIIGRPENFKNRSDRPAAAYFRRGVYALVDIPKGSDILREHLACCRPESEFSPKDLDKIIGRRARCDIKANTPLTNKCL